MSPSPLKLKEKLETDGKRGSASLFQCQICWKKFKSKYILADHVQTVHGTARPHACSKCSYTCKRKHDLKTHIRRVHEKLLPQVCIFCDKNFLKMGDLNKHLRAHVMEKPYSCLHCGESFTERHNLERHIKTIHLKLRLGIKCPGCPKYLANEENYQKHLETHNFEKRDCDTCGKSFSSEFTLAQHVTRMHSDRLVECEFCSKRFVDEKAYRDHRRYHAETKSAVCPTCGKAFLKCELRKHIRNVHEPHRFSCEFCQKTFSTSSALRLHRIRVHTFVPDEIKPFECSTCGKRYLEKGDLKRHEAYHETSRPFGCALCNKCFKVKSSLTKHERLLHDPTFKRKIKFRMCPHCLRGFRSSSYLKYHIARVHLGEPPQFSCIFCGTTTTQKSGLYNHIRMCIREKPNICEWEGCDYSAVTKANLRKHLEKMHSENYFV